MAGIPKIEAEILSFYAQGFEGGRLQHGAGQLEYVRTLELIERFAPPPPATILDVGGGPGPYAIALAGRGYRVHLIDPVPDLVAEAGRRSRQAAVTLASCAEGDARQLDWASGEADLVLLLGPLYHLTEREDRARALGEAFRVLKPGGLLFAAAISRFASALDGLVHDRLRDSDFTTIVEQDLATGQHRNRTGRPEYFTTAYFHHPDELPQELDRAGFKVQGVFGLEGPGWLLQDFDTRWGESRTREDILKLARVLEAESSLQGLSAHLLAIGSKPRIIFV